MSWGYIKLHRQLRKCWVWDDDEPFDKRSAWIDLLLMVNHADKKILFEGEVITVKKGQVVTSILKLSERWKWNRKKTKRFLTLLENDEMVTTECTTHGTTVTIVNWDKYQLEGTTNAPTNGTTEGQPRDNHGTTEGQPRDINKNDKEIIKNEKNVKNVFKKPSLEEVKAYIEEKGYSIDAERFINYYESNGWMVGRNKMKNWKAAVSNWASKDKPKTNTSYDDAVKAFLESED